MHRNSIRDLELGTVRRFPLSLSVSLEFLLRNKRLARVSTPPYSSGSNFNASTSISLGFLIRIIQFCRTLENQSLKIATVRHFLLNLSVSLEFLFRNDRLARVSTPPYSFGSSFNASISIWFGFLIRIIQIYETLYNSIRFHLWNGSVSDPRPRPWISQICRTVIISNRLTA